MHRAEMLEKYGIMVVGNYMDIVENSDLKSLNDIPSILKDSWPTFRHGGYTYFAVGIRNMPWQTNHLLCRVKDEELLPVVNGVEVFARFNTNEDGTIMSTEAITATVQDLVSALLFSDNVNTAMETFLHEHQPSTTTTSFLLYVLRKR